MSIAKKSDFVALSKSPAAVREQCRRLRKLSNAAGSPNNFEFRAKWLEFLIGDRWEDPRDALKVLP